MQILRNAGPQQVLRNSTCGRPGLHDEGDPHPQGKSERFILESFLDPKAILASWLSFYSDHAIEIGNMEEEWAFFLCREEALPTFVLDLISSTKVDKKEVKNISIIKPHSLSLDANQNPNCHSHLLTPNTLIALIAFVKGQLQPVVCPHTLPPAASSSSTTPSRGSMDLRGMAGYQLVSALVSSPKMTRTFLMDGTRKNSDDVLKKEKSEDDKIRFASYRRKKGHVDPLPGRVFWREWVTTNYTTHWKIHTIVKDALTDANIHPVQLMVEYDDLETSPSSEHYLPGIIDTIAPILFGTASLDNGNRLSRELRTPTIALLGRTWALALRSMAGRRKAMAKLEKTSNDILDSLEEEPLTIKAINRAVKAVANFQQAVEAVPLSKSDARKSTQAKDNQASTSDNGRWRQNEELSPSSQLSTLLPPSATTPTLALRWKRNKSEEQLIAALGFDDGVTPTLQQDSSHHMPYSLGSPSWNSTSPENPNQRRRHWKDNPIRFPPRIHSKCLASPFSWTYYATNCPCCERRFMKGSTDIPSSPSVIVVPTTLVKQWESECKMFFAPRKVAIFVYPTSAAQREQFWVKDGPYHSCTVPESHRIILTSQSTLQQDFSSPSSRKASSWSFALGRPHPPHKDYENRIRKTIYSREFTCAIIDEAQSVRNPGAKHSSVLLLLEKATQLLQTSPKDIASMGRMVGIPHFYPLLPSPTRRAMPKKLRKAKLEDGGVDENDEESALAMLRVAISRRMQEQFGDFIIQRTANSPGPNGPLIALPECIIIDCNMDLTERRFYVDHRLNVSYPSRKDPDDAYPVFVAMEDWQESGSTKLNNLIAIIQHLLLRDDMLPDIKIVVYQEFVTLSSLIKSSCSISGRTSIKQRAKIIEMFNNDPYFRVLIFSKVGAVGLNLTRANIVIILQMTTADVPLAAIARGKKAMLDAFITRDSTKGIVGGSKDEEDEEEQEDPVTQHDKPKRRVEGNQGRRVCKGEEGEDESIEKYDFPAEKADDQSMDEASQSTTSSTTVSDIEDPTSFDVNMSSPREPPESESEPEDEVPPSMPVYTEPHLSVANPLHLRNGGDDVAEHSSKATVPGSHHLPKASSSTVKPTCAFEEYVDLPATNSRPNSPTLAPPTKMKKKAPVKPYDFPRIRQTAPRLLLLQPAVAPKALPAAFKATQSQEGQSRPVPSSLAWSIYQPSAWISHSSKSSALYLSDVLCCPPAVPPVRNIQSFVFIRTLFPTTSRPGTSAAVHPGQISRQCASPTFSPTFFLGNKWEDPRRPR
ncbi:hypothetical protein BKA70DRAFT_1225396 [Coprinopsis sp. MPI-PUGE-AT-0042]|nr:hypothetical protein BKA70DRAFT_1225396 [Coprinopsis sp. MPI-PUGE-AT-0042]